MWNATVFTKSRDRLLKAEVAKDFLEQVVAHTREQRWMSDELFPVDGTLLEAWASLRSLQRKDKPKGTARQATPRSINSQMEERGHL